MRLLILLFLTTAAFASEFTSRGEITFESRFFQPDDNSKTKDLGYGLASRLEGSNYHGNFEERFRIFSRNDEQDTSRGVLIVEEAFIGYTAEKWSVKIGNQILNWSATEAFHPADIINSRNFDSNIENPEKFGEPMVNFSYLFDNGAFNAYFMPFLTQAKLPANTNRLSFRATRSITLKEGVFLERDGTLSDDNFAPQFALKYDMTFGTADISIYYIQMIDRFFTGTATETTLNVPTAARIIYLPINQVGFTYQHAIEGGWVLKLETAYKDFVNPDQDFTMPSGTIIDYERPDHLQIAWGIEYGFGHKGGGESAFVLEGQNFEGTTADERISLGLFQRDILFGYRFAFNDTQSKEIFASFIMDLERTNEVLGSISYSQRLSDTWSLRSSLRFTEAPKKGTNFTNLENLHEANYFTLNLTRYF